MWRRSSRKLLWAEQQLRSQTLYHSSVGLFTARGSLGFQIQFFVCLFVLHSPPEQVSQGSIWNSAVIQGKLSVEIIKWTGDAYGLVPREAKTLVLYKGQISEGSWIATRVFQTQGHTPEYPTCKAQLPVLVHQLKRLVMKDKRGRFIHCGHIWKRDR